MPIMEIPETSKCNGYNYDSQSWVKISCNFSGQVAVQHGATLETYKILPISNNSGGEYIGSGAIDRLVISIPNVGMSGTNNYGNFWNSGTPDGAIIVGGISSFAPYSDANYVCSSYGLYLGPGQIKQIHIADMNQVKAVAVRSGDPISILTEIVTD